MSVAGFPNANFGAAAALAEELARSGVRHACVCPGSRSAPLAAALAREPGLRVFSHLDERSAGFFALGLAKASRSPVAIACTSGTAAANLHPAVVEAHHARVPLVVLTANRPPELRDWGAGQTIDQTRLYGTAVRWFAEAPVPEPGEAVLRLFRALACRAVALAAGRPAGPVHLDLPFREPLAPTPVPGEDRPAPGSLAAEGRGAAPYTRIEPIEAALPPEPADRLASLLRDCERGAVVCGPLDASPDLSGAIAQLSAALGWPLLAEPTSQLRRGPHVAKAPLVARADLWLRHEETASRLSPECVLHFGDTPTSKALRLWLERSAPRQFLAVDPDGVWHDPSQLASERVRAEPLALCRELLRRAAPRRGETPWLREFLRIDRIAADAADARLEDEAALLSPRVARELAAALPDGALLYVSNSLAVRDLDAFLPPGPRELRVLCNRGANGIDGLVSSALGAAAAGGAPVALLTGDLAFLHDVGGLLAAQRHRLHALVAVVDDGGGGIFSFLPIAAHGEAVAFDDVFRLAHDVDLGAVARGFGAGFTDVVSWEHLRAAVKEALAAPGVHVIRIRVEAARNLAHHRELERAVAQALSGAAG